MVEAETKRASLACPWWIEEAIKEDPTVALEISSNGAE